MEQRALVIGATGGIGAALASHLALQGWQVTGLSRRDGLDITDEATIAAALAPLAGPYDLVFVATGALAIPGGAPEKMLRAVTAEALTAQLAVNAIGPLLVLKHSVRLLPRDRRAVFAALSARVGSIGDNALGGWYSYRASKAALNQLIHTAAIELGRSHPKAICAAIHPGTVATAFTRAYQSSHPTIAPAEAAARIAAALEALTPAQSGGFFDNAGQPIPLVDAAEPCRLSAGSTASTDGDPWHWPPG